MNTANSMNVSSLLMASSLVLISLFFCYYQKLKLEKEIIIGVLRAVIQLAVVGYVLNFVFGLKNPLFTTFLIIFMTFNAAVNASKRGKSIKGSLLISFVSIACGTILTLSVLILAKAIKYEPFQIIPVGGMVISNAMVAIGLCYKQLISNFEVKKQEVETKLALGADVFLSSKEIIRDSIKTSLLPTIDSMKTLGIVSLPGTMTGLILAGTSPIEAIKFQIMVTFMLSSTTTIAAFICCYLSYKKFFNDRKQLKVKVQ
ncbi:iron export ABC transporter permease subunit FetB [Clostridium sp. P21]|uniref:Iron export ABC transporter permease subunit FetB n=1 Tax=Clostridium muellerianum TaxID=2716538 RepID=A0A7Y0EJT1_9CLOT|nr:iron export ABC transporter permease subunit FetB [Clostridium muellerianum]NMM64672.1 iron export ABC transporter permease subunit FetB [Clostridium muellerianum]